MNRRAPWKRALLKVAALAGLLNLVACLGGRPAAPAFPLVAYGPEFQQGAAVELARAMDPGGACYSPHLVTFVVDYKRLRDAVRIADPQAPFTTLRPSGRDPEPTPTPATPNGETANASP